MRAFVIAALAASCVACAGRDPQPVATVQVTDANATCAMIVAEIEANNIKVKELAGEEGGKVAQNVVAGVAGVFIPVLGSGWISKARPARKWLRCKRASNTSRRWRQNGVRKGDGDR